MTSAITAPLAACYAVAGAMGWPRDLRNRRLRAVWGAVLLAGVPFAIAGTRPAIPLGFGEVSIIVFAQVANGILLPAIAIFLLVAVNDRSRMGAHANGPVRNAAGAIVVLLAAVLGMPQPSGAPSAEGDLPSACRRTRPHSPWHGRSAAA
jgi:manganese transport protein